MTSTVYIAWDADDQPLYVGCSRRFARRMTEHKMWSAWWGEHASITTTEHVDHDAALLAEFALIQKHRPPHNRRHNRTYWSPEVCACRTRSCEHCLARAE